MTFEGRPVGELAREADAEDREWTRHEAAAAEHERVVAESAAASSAAEGALRELLGGDEARAEDYLRQCAEHRRYADAHRRAEDAAARARAAAAPAEAVRDAEQALHDADQDLRRLLSARGHRARRPRRRA